MKTNFFISILSLLLMQVVSLQAQNENKVTSVDTLRLSNSRISGSNIVCDTETFTIENSFNPTAYHTWTTSNNCLSIISGQGTKTVTVQKNIPGICILSVQYEYGPFVVWQSSHVNVGTPDLGMSILFTTSNGHHGVWGSNMNNTFTLENDMSDAYDRVEAKLYSIDSNFNLSQLVQSWTNISTTFATINGLTPGFYFFELRGINDCGYSNWLSQEVEVVNFSELNFLLDYEPSSEMLTLTLNEPLTPSSQITETNNLVITTEKYEIQIWNGIGANMISNYMTDLTTFQIPLTGLPRGIYIVRVIKDGQTYSRKFMKK